MISQHQNTEFLCWKTFYCHGNWTFGKILWMKVFRIIPELGIGGRLSLESRPQNTEVGIFDNFSGLCFVYLRALIH